MNNNRRATLRKVISEIQAQLSVLEDAKGEEEEAFENMPESLQMSERGEKAEAAVDCLDNALANLEEAISQMEEAIE